MLNCEICGRGLPLFKTEIEGTEINVCDYCCKFGKVLGKVSTTPVLNQKPFFSATSSLPEIEENVSSDFPEMIRNAREKKGLNQKDFSQLLNERESLVQKWEAGLSKPKLEIARKLERLLGIHLIEVQENKVISLEKTKSEELTLGDMI